jgi:heat-inducible transcriptional repressor
VKNLSERASSVLYAVVSEFIRAGEPVGSRTLSTRYGFELSAATIRNVLKDLEEDGYLTQPHTSAGRVPTPAAFRLFIDALMRLKKLREEDSERIRELFSHAMAPELRLREAGRLLSELSGAPAVAIRTHAESRRIQRIRFIVVQPSELLSVLVFEGGTVENRFIAVEGAPGAAQLERLHHLLDEVAVGRTLLEMRTQLAEATHRERDEMRSVGLLGEALLGEAIVGVEASRDVIVEGRSNLVNVSGNPEHLRRLMEALDDREQLLELLDRTAVSSNVQVYLGNDGVAASPESPLSLVAAAYGRQDSAHSGALGVLGPTRMDYPGLVPLVGAMASAMSADLGVKASEAQSPIDRGSDDS